MSYSESGVRLRRRGLLPLGFYKAALAISLTANVLLAISVWEQDSIAKVEATVKGMVAYMP